MTCLSLIDACDMIQGRLISSNAVKGFEHQTEEMAIRFYVQGQISLG